MFTGIVTDIGAILDVEAKATGARLAIATSYGMGKINTGASIACAGICLTVTDKGENAGKAWFAVDVSGETIARTTLGEWREGARINLERALKIGDELGGHFVTGHVDGVAETSSVTPRGEHRMATFSAPPGLERFIAEKGSVALDGVSLTVNGVNGREFSVNLVPHTLANTTLSSLAPGARVNLEIDLIARYAARISNLSS